MEQKIKLSIFIIFLFTFSFLIRIFRITEPPKYYFDEVYHVVTAKAYANNNPVAYDPFSKAPEEETAYDWLHPPLAKLIQAASIKILGDNSFGWRLPSALFGTGIVIATAVLAYSLFGKTAAIFSALIIAFENLNLAMSRITMNDVFVTFFTIMAFAFAVLYVKSSTSEESPLSGAHLGGIYKNKWLILTSIFLGFSIASKWTGLYTAVIVISYIFLNKFKDKKLTPKLLILIILPPLIYLASYGQFWLQGHSIRQFIDLHKQIWWYQNTPDLKHSYGTTPLYCVPEGLNGPKTWCPWFLNIRGVYFSYEGYGGRAGYIYALGNPFIFWFGVIAISYLIGLFLEEKKKEYGLVILGYFIFWIPWIFTPRLLFLHHYLPSIPFLSISLGIALAKIWQTKFKLISILLLLLFAVMFFYFYPISTGYPINPDSLNKYMWLKTWR